MTSVSIVVSSATGICCDGKGECTLFSEAPTAAGRREEGCFLEQAVLCGGQVPACTLDPPPCLPLSVSTQAPSLSQALPKGSHLSPQSHLLGQPVQSKKETDAVGDIFLALSRDGNLDSQKCCVQGEELRTHSGSELGTEMERVPQPRFGDVAGPVPLQSSQTCTPTFSHWFGFKCGQKKNISDTVCGEREV